MTDAALLEVAVLHARDVPGCVDGGADRLSLAARTSAGPRSPDLPLASSVIRGSDLPVRVLLRTDDTLSLSGGQLMRLIGLAEEYLALGAEGVELGFLDGDLEIDVDTCAALVDALPGVAWTCPRATFDATLDLPRSWRRVAGLPGLTTVRSAGSAQGIAAGYDDLLALAGSPDVARLLMPSGGLTPEHVPWLVRAGVRQAHLDLQVRPGSTHRSYVDADYVRSWRRLLDDAVTSAARRVG